MLQRRNFLEFAAAAALLAPVSASARSGQKGDDPARADASAMARALQDGKVSPAALVDAAVRRLEAASPELNATHYLYLDDARAAAETAVTNASPLSGIPTFIKDLADEKGRIASAGSRAFANRTAEHDSPAVAALRKAGLISLGHTNVPEFGLLPTTEPLLTGPTRNPWNPRYSAGGSSGGAAALVAAGVVPVAHASDGGGSIRIPASMNGLVGLKPSRARMAGEEGHRGVNALSVNGCLSRTVRDTAAWLAACESHDGPLKPVGLVTGSTRRAMRIGLRSAGALGPLADADVQAVFDQCRQLLTRLRHRIVDAPLPFDGAETADAFELLWGAGAAQAIQGAGKYLGRQPTVEDIEPATFGFATLAANATPADVEAASGRLQKMSSLYLAQFDAFDVLVTPVLGTPPPELGFIAPTVPFDTLRQRLHAIIGYTPVENAAGNPAISLPMGMSGDGLPIGLQFTGPYGSERRLLELAYTLEAELRWEQSRPAIWTA